MDFVRHNAHEPRQLTIRPRKIPAPTTIVGACALIWQTHQGPEAADEGHFAHCNRACKRYHHFICLAVKSHRGQGPPPIRSPSQWPGMARPSADARRSLIDPGILDLSRPMALEAGAPRSANGTPGPQMLRQFLLQSFPRLYVQASVESSCDTCLCDTAGKRTRVGRALPQGLYDFHEGRACFHEKRTPHRGTTRSFAIVIARDGWLRIAVVPRPLASRHLRWNSVFGSL